MSGGTDDDDVIVRSFEAFEINGQIDAEMFRHSLMTWGEKFSSNEIDDAFRVQDRRRHDRRRTPQEHHGGEEGRRGIIPLSKNLISSRKTTQAKMGLFLDSQENATCDKISLKAGTNIYQQPTAGAEPKKPPRNLVYQKCIRIRADKRNIKGILICESTKRKYLSVAIVNECK